MPRFSISSGTLRLIHRAFGDGVGVMRPTGRIGADFCDILAVFVDHHFKCLQAKLTYYMAQHYKVAYE